MTMILGVLKPSVAMAAKGATQSKFYLPLISILCISKASIASELRFQRHESNFCITKCSDRRVHYHSPVCGELENQICSRAFHLYNARTPRQKKSPNLSVMILYLVLRSHIGLCQPRQRSCKNASHVRVKSSKAYCTLGSKSQRLSFRGSSGVAVVLSGPYASG